MADTRKKDVPIGCPDYTVNSLLMEMFDAQHAAKRVEDLNSLQTMKQQPLILKITSIMTLVISLTLKYEFSIFGNYLEYYSGKPILSLLIASVVTFLNGLFGYVSLQKKSHCGIITFIICTMYLFVSVVALVGMTLIFSVEAEHEMYSNLKEDMRNKTAHSDTIDAIQSHLNCCGYKDFTDMLNDSSSSLPQSCCISSVICDAKNSSDVRTVGCRDAIFRFLTCRKWFVVGVLAILGIIEICSIVLSLIVYQRLIKIHTTQPTVDNIPRVNPLPSVGNNAPYVRRPTQLPVVLNYRSAHENYLKQPPQYRFDRRSILQ